MVGGGAGVESYKVEGHIAAVGELVMGKLVMGAGTGSPPWR